MKQITINASKTYNVIVGQHLISELGTYASDIVNPGKAVLISDSNVWSLYGATATGSLARAGFKILDCILPAGEQSKNGDTYLKLLGYLADNHIQKGDVIVALGGGVVGDISGFLAATYLRGIPYIQVPTTLLSMVDSSVGGRTSINLPAGRNLAGAIYQPSLVLCDTLALDSLAPADFHDGCAEVIKYCMLFDAELFAHMATHLDTFDREFVVGRCIELKSNIIFNSESDRNKHQLLNLGHTIARAVEVTDNYMTSHGKAIAIGIAAACRASNKLGICEKSLVDTVVNTLKAFSLPVGSAHTVEDIYDCALSIKRQHNGKIRLILPKEIGQCIIYTTDSDGLKAFIEDGL